MTDYRFDAQKARTAALAYWGTPANTINQPEPPADGEVAELVAELRHFVAEYQQMRGLDPENIYSIHQGHPEKEAHLRSSQIARAADLLERLAEPEPPRRNFVGGYQPRPSIGTHNPPPKNP
jgi:hypothetical protein